MMPPDPAEAPEKLGILAGGGTLPRKLIEACRRQGRPYFVIAFDGQTAPETVEAADGESISHAWVRLGAAGKTIETLRGAGVRDLVLAGGINRPSMTSVMPDAWGMKFLARTGAGGLGDDGFLSALIRALETEEEFHVVGVHTLLPEILAEQGVIGAAKPDEGGLRDIEKGVKAALSLGASDKGQAVVVRGGETVMQEDARGTDAMLAQLAKSGHGTGGVLVKVSKPGQETRADLPAIGPGTVLEASAAGLSGIAVEAGAAIIVERDDVIEAADKAGIFVAGVIVEKEQPERDAFAGPEIFLIAGEASGDALGARLMAALKAQASLGVTFSGIGGPLMAAQGLRSIFPMNDLAVMGLAEVLPRIPKLFRRIRQAEAEIRRRRPACVITIDAPDFNFRVAKRLMGSGIPVVHYVAPTVWAWRPGRAKKIAPYLDHLLALLPFEPPYFTDVGLDCTFVGHSVIERDGPAANGASFREDQGIAETAPVLCVLPGSRGSEASRLLPVFGDAVKILAESHPGLSVVIPAQQTVAGLVRRETATWAGRVIVVEGEAEKAGAFAAADAALAASGTVSLELALAGVPMVIAYKVSPVTAWLALRMIRVPFVCLINIILGREAVPEYLQGNCRPDWLAREVTALLDDESARNEQLAAANEAMTALGMGGTPPSSRAARVIWDLIGNKGTVNG